MYAYDPINNKWSTKAPPPTPRALLTLATANGIIYAIGGFDKQGPVSAFEAYDIASDKWITLAPTIVRGRQALHSEVVNGTLYVISGEGSGGSTGPVASVLAVTAYTLPTLESSRGSSQDSVPKP